MATLDSSLSDNEFYVAADAIMGDKNLVRKCYLNPEHAEKIARGLVIAQIYKEQKIRIDKGLPKLTYAECFEIMGNVIMNLTLSVGGRSHKVLERVMSHKIKVLERKKKYRDDDD